MAKKATSKTVKSATKNKVSKTAAKTAKTAKATSKAQTVKTKTGKTKTSKATTTSTSVRPASTAKRSQSTGAAAGAAKSVSFLDSLGGPARRALAQAGITTARKLAAKREAEILALHGVGPASLPALQRALTTAGLRFRA
jgi:hypothetical protein